MFKVEPDYSRGEEQETKGPGSEIKTEMEIDETKVEKFFNSLTIDEKQNMLICYRLQIGSVNEDELKCIMRMSEGELSQGIYALLAPPPTQPRPTPPTPPSPPTPPTPSPHPGTANPDMPLTIDEKQNMLIWHRLQIGCLNEDGLKCIMGMSEGELSQQIYALLAPPPTPSSQSLPTPSPYHAEANPDMPPPTGGIPTPPPPTPATPSPHPAVANPDMPLPVALMEMSLKDIYQSTPEAKQQCLMDLLHIDGLNVEGAKCIKGMKENVLNQRLHPLIGPPLYGRIVNLKVHGAGDLAKGLIKIAASRAPKKSDIGQGVIDTLRKVAESIVERRSRNEEGSKITNPDQLYKLFNQTGGPADYVFRAFCDSRYNISWQTEDGLPTVDPTDIHVNHKNQMTDKLVRQIFHRVQTVLSPPYWKKKVSEYRQRMMDQMDDDYMNEAHIPKLPPWFESKDGQTVKFLEKQFPECQEVLMERKKTEIKTKHDTDTCSRAARCAKCVRPSNGQNVAYFWTVDLGEHLSTSRGIRCRSYAGKATGGNLCKDRWYRHFKEAQELIEEFVQSTTAPGCMRHMMLVDVVLALAIVEGLESALYCVRMFDEPTHASAYESLIIKGLNLQDIDKGLNDAS